MCKVFAKIAAIGCRQERSICRQDFSIAFDPISEPERNTVQSASSLEHSVFDRTTTTIAIDVAPYVRSIVAYDAKLQQERAQLSNLLSEGGRKGKLRNGKKSGMWMKIIHPNFVFQVFHYNNNKKIWSKLYHKNLNELELDKSFMFSCSTGSEVASGYYKPRPLTTSDRITILALFIGGSLLFVVPLLQFLSRK